MLAQGVSLNNAILDIHNTNSSTTNTKNSADLNQNQTNEKQMSSSQLNATNDSTSDKQGDDSNKLESNKELEPQKVCLVKIVFFLSFIKFYCLRRK